MGGSSCSKNKPCAGRVTAATRCDLMLHSSRCQCIPFTAVCDVHVDCSDASDELSCDYEVQQTAELVYPAIMD